MTVAKEKKQHDEHWKLNSVDTKETKWIDLSTVDSEQDNLCETKSSLFEQWGFKLGTAMFLNKLFY